MRHDVDVNDDGAKAALGRVTALESRVWGRSVSSATDAPGRLPPPADGELWTLPVVEPWSRVEGAAPPAAGALWAAAAAAATPSAAPQVTVEEVLGGSARAASRAWAALVHSGLAFPPIRDGAGVERPVTATNYAGHALSDDRVRREAALRSRNGEFGRHANTLAELLGWAVKAVVLQAKAGGYDSVLAAALGFRGIPTAVYTSLLSTVQAALPRTLHKYMALRGRLLGARSSAGEAFQLRPWDVHAPLIPGVDFRFPYDAGRAAVVESVAPLGSAYQEALRKGLYEQRWVDVFPNQGKRAGAYSGGSHETLPFIFLNYEDSLAGVTTLAHEAGHSGHSALARATQPASSSGYSTFIAEVASTVNEALLFDTLRARASSPAQRAAVLAAQLDRVVTVFFRQAQLAQFELSIHEAAVAGTPLTPGFFNATYANISATYHGPALVPDPVADVGWARILHFFHPYGFYVYQYATSFAASAMVVDRFQGGKMDVETYLDALRAGGSAGPLEILQAVGVNATSTAPVTAVCDKFEALVDELEALAATLDLQPSPSPSSAPAA